MAPKISNGILLPDMKKQEAAEYIEERRDQVLKATPQTYEGLPPITGINPPGYRIPESKKARAERVKAEKEAELIIHPPKQEDKHYEIEQNLTEADWQRVSKAFAVTGKPGIIAKATDLPTKAVKHIIDNGITRLGLPGIKQHSIDQAQLNLDIQETEEKHKKKLMQSDVTEAIQKRATQEASSAKLMLDQTMEVGTIVGGYVKAFFNTLKRGEATLSIPERVDLEALENLTKVLDSYTKSMERAVKLVNLTQGKPTERVEHQIGAMLAVCTTKELEAAASTGNLPARLTSRLGSTEPMREGESNIIEAHAVEIQNKDNTADEAPEWLQSIKQAEGESTEDA